MEEGDDNNGASGGNLNSRLVNFLARYDHNSIVNKLEIISTLKAKLLNTYIEVAQGDKSSSSDYQRLAEDEILEKLCVDTETLGELLTAIKMKEDTEMHEKEANLLARIFQENKISLKTGDSDEDEGSLIEDAPQIGESIKDVMKEAKVCNAELDLELQMLSAKEEELQRLKRELQATRTINQQLKEECEQVLKTREISAEESKYEEEIMEQVDMINEARCALIELLPVSNLLDEKKKTLYRKYGKQLDIKEWLNIKY